MSEVVLEALVRPPGTLGPTPHLGEVDPLASDDLALALYLCYELHYRDMAGVDPGWEWDPQLLAFRGYMERVFLHRVRDEVGPIPPTTPEAAAHALVELIAGASGPSLSTYMVDAGTWDQLREFCIHRSAYQLKEADPHTFAIPRLSGEAKVAMVEIQRDEYGSGDTAEMHSALFAETMSELGLDPTYGAYLPRLPGSTLATVNLISLLGLHRRWRAAAVGHLAVFEMTSVEPMGRYSRALERMGVGARGRRFYEVHVHADVRHSVIALERMVGGLLQDEPDLVGDLLFGAAAVLMVEERFTAALLGAWASGRSSLLPG
jgi:hypothetical protein